MITRSQTAEDLFLELEGRFQSIRSRLEQLRRENAQLLERIRKLEQAQATACAKINQMLDRMDALG